MSWVKSASCVAVMAAFSSVTAWGGQADSTQSIASVLAAAGEAQARGDFSTAAGYYRQAVKMRPGTAELWANLGLMQDLAGNTAEAAKSFGEAAHLNGSMYVPQLFLGIENLKLNHADAAIPFLEKAEQINPKDPQVPLALGRALALVGKADHAGDAYLRATALKPDDGNAWLGLGMAKMQQSSADDRRMTEAFKDSPWTRLHAAETFAEQGRLDRASAAYSSLLAAQSPAPPCAHAGYGMVLLRQQETAKAGEELEQEIRLNPGCGLAKLGLAALHLQQAETETALRDLDALWHADRNFFEENLPLLREVLTDAQREQLLRMAAELEARAETPVPEAANPHAYGNAHALYAAGQYQNCSENLRPTLNTLSAASLSVLAPCAFNSGDYTTASLAARRLKALPASQVGGLYWESKADQKLAIAALARAGEIGSASPQLHVLLGDIYRQKQRWEDAVQEYQKALALDPHHPSARLGLAMALFGDAKNNAALEAVQAILAEDPDKPEENLLAGEILVHAGRYAEAEVYLKKVPDQGQKFMPHAHTLLGQVYLATDRLPQALTEFTLSQASDEDGSIHYQMGRIYQKLGEKEKAAEAFRVSKRLREQSDERLYSTPQ